MAISPMIPAGLHPGTDRLQNGELAGNAASHAALRCAESTPTSADYRLERWSVVGHYSAKCCLLISEKVNVRLVWKWSMCNECPLRRRELPVELQTVSIGWFAAVMSSLFVNQRLQCRSALAEPVQSSALTLDRNRKTFAPDHPCEPFRS